MRSPEPVAASGIPTRRALGGNEIAKHPGYVRPHNRRYTCSICGLVGGWKALGFRAWGLLESEYGFVCRDNECEQQFEQDIEDCVIYDPDGFWRQSAKGRHCQHRDHPDWHPNAKESET